MPTRLYPQQPRLLAINPYSMQSASARALATSLKQHLGRKVLRLYTHKANPITERRGLLNLINWGSSKITTGANRVYNSPEAVAVACNKLQTFQTLHNNVRVNIPPWTQSKDMANTWISQGHVVVVRHVLRGHSGRGIEIVDSGTVPAAPLYVKYIERDKEFRVHVAFGGVIDVQEKRRRRKPDDQPPANDQVRNHQTGWVYCRENIQEPQGLRDMAKLVISTIGLDFGAVDLIYSSEQDIVYVLEVNTAPGLTGTTLINYTNAFIRGIRNETIHW